MTYLLLLIPLFVFITVAIKNKWFFDFKSFLAKTLPLMRGTFGVYCFTGKQGTGKTYSLTKFIHRNAIDKKIYSNVEFKSGIEYEPIKSMEHLLSLRDEKDVIIVFDEIFTIMNKQTKLNSDIMEFLSQMRKQRNIFITTAQEWLELPMTYRRFVRVQIDCATRPLGRFGGILTERYYDATQMQWDQLQNEYVAPIIRTKFSKYEKRFMESYDTEQRITFAAAKTPR